MVVQLESIRKTRESIAMFQWNDDPLKLKNSNVIIVDTCNNTEESMPYRRIWKSYFEKLISCYHNLSTSSSSESLLLLTRAHLHWSLSNGKLNVTALIELLMPLSWLCYIIKRRIWKVKQKQLRPSAFQAAKSIHWSSFSSDGCHYLPVSIWQNPQYAG